MASLREEVVLPSGEATVTWNCSRCAFSTSTRTITGTCPSAACSHSPQGNKVAPLTYGPMPQCPVLTIFAVRRHILERTCNSLQEP